MPRDMLRIDRAAGERAGQFFIAVRRAMLPLLVWAGHFALVYVTTAVACMRGLVEARVGGAPLLQGTLGAFGAIAVVWLVILLVRQDRNAVRGTPGLIDDARRIATVLALVGVTWTSVAILIPPGC
jgi:hypothetical protein